MKENIENLRENKMFWRDVNCIRKDKKQICQFIKGKNGEDR